MKPICRHWQYWRPFKPFTEMFEQLTTVTFEYPTCMTLSLNHVMLTCTTQDESLMKPLLTASPAGRWLHLIRGYIKFTGFSYTSSRNWVINAMYEYICVPFIRNLVLVAMRDTAQYQLIQFKFVSVSHIVNGHTTSIRYLTRLLFMYICRVKLIIILFYFVILFLCMYDLPCH